MTSWTLTTTLEMIAVLYCYIRDVSFSFFFPTLQHPVVNLCRLYDYLKDRSVLLMKANIDVNVAVEGRLIECALLMNYIITYSYSLSNGHNALMP